MSRLVVKSHRPLQLAVAIVALSSIIAVITWLLLDTSHWSYIYNRLGKNHDLKMLWEVNKELKKENTDLQERVVMLERSTELDKQTAVLLQNELTSLQDEISRLKRELEFYQGVMDDTRESSGLQVQGLHITPLSRERSYHLSVVLTHVAKGDMFTEGVMDITIEGTVGKTVRKLKLKELISDEALDLSFKFKNFKRFGSNITLPLELVPQKVIVEIQPKDKKQANIRKVFDWQTAAS